MLGGVRPFRIASTPVTPFQTTFLKSLKFMSTHQPNKKRAREWEDWQKQGDTTLLDNLNGVIAVFKPEGSSSSDVVQQVRRSLETHLYATGVPKRPRGKPLVKVGHGGTLDPLATGVLVVGIGTGCREMGSYLKGTKRYHGLGRLGSEYDTQDCTGKV